MKPLLRLTSLNRYMLSGRRRKQVAAGASNLVISNRYMLSGRRRKLWVGAFRLLMSQLNRYMLSGRRRKLHKTLQLKDLNNE